MVPTVMQSELADNMLRCFDAYVVASGRSRSEAALRIARDKSFFERIKGGKGFTARKYGEVMEAFSDNWPDGASWPPGVPRVANSSNGPARQHAGAA